MNTKTLNGLLLDERAQFSLNELSSACCSSAEWIIELVEEGALEPITHSRHETQPGTQSDTQPNAQYIAWRFSADSLRKAQTAMRLQRDLNINLAGTALALDLLQQIENLESQLRRYEADTFKQNLSENQT